MAVRKILIFTPPFLGHSNVLARLGTLLTGHGIEYKVVVTGWANIPVPANLGDVYHAAAPDLHSTDPALWTFPRVAQLLPECLDIATSYQPDLIIYDFFSVEGYFVARQLGISYWCSIPALLGPYTSQDYLWQKLQQPENQRALADIKSRFGITVDELAIEMVSDGLLMPGQVNLVWSYDAVTPPAFRQNRSAAPYVFIGGAAPRVPVTKTSVGHSKGTHHHPRVYISFGTVVMDNLWRQQPATRQAMQRFIGHLAELWADKPWDIVFVAQGKTVLPHYPANWQIHDTADQLQELAQADVFVTHGGNNSFHESIAQRTSMVVVPFFGDQPLVARRAQELGIGINMRPDAVIDTNASKQFLDASFARKLNTAVRQVLEDPKYLKNISQLDLHGADVLDVIRGHITFQEGDLLFGTNVARKNYIDTAGLQDEFKILEFKAFSELFERHDALPKIVDMYHDVILSDDYFKADMASGLDIYKEQLVAYKAHLNGETDFEKMCIKGLDFFTQFYKIHFILDDYNPALNRITTSEIRHVLADANRFQETVTFYRKIAGVYIPVSFNEVALLIRQA